MRVRANQVFAVLFLCLAGALAYDVSLIRLPELGGDPGPRLLPYFVAASMAILAVVLFFLPEGAPEQIDEFSEAEEDRQPSVVADGPLGLMARYGPLAGVTACTILLAYFFTKVGFTISVGLFLFAAMSLMGKRTANSLLVYAVVAVAVTYGLGFILRGILRMPLPGVIL